MTGKIYSFTSEDEWTAAERRVCTWGLDRLHLNKHLMVGNILVDKEHLSSLASTSLPIAENNASGSTEERRVHEISKTRKREPGTLIASKISSTWLEVRNVCGTIMGSEKELVCEVYH